MRSVALVLFYLVFASCARSGSGESVVPTTPTSGDSIEKLVQTLNSDTHGMWVNGAYPIISLPEDAKPEAVLAQAFKMTGFDKGHIKTYRIREVRGVELTASGMKNCFAVLVESDLGTPLMAILNPLDHERLILSCVLVSISSNPPFPT